MIKKYDSKYPADVKTHNMKTQSSKEGFGNPLGGEKGNISECIIKQYNHLSEGSSQGLGFVSIPRTVGYVEIVPNFHVGINKWPNWFHRTSTRLLLGWKWVKTEK